MSAGKESSAACEQESVPVDVEWMVMVDWLGYSGVYGRESRFYRGRSEAAVLEEAQLTSGNAGVVEVFRREVRVPWEKVEEFRRGE